VARRLDAAFRVESAFGRGEIGVHRPLLRYSCTSYSRQVIESVVASQYAIDQMLYRLSKKKLSERLASAISDNLAKGQVWSPSRAIDRLVL
jgi:hypothetical protein